MVPFGGWEMPVQYPKGIIHETGRVRSSAGIFDVSHMARFELSGPGTGRFLDRVLSVEASSLRHGQAKYHLICDLNGGIIDDAIVYRLEHERFLLVSNAGNADAVREWMLGQLMVASEDSAFRVSFNDVTESIGMIAMQGPQAVAMLDRLCEGEAGRIRRFHAGEITIDGELMLAARTGYTGEDGFELMFDYDHGIRLWSVLVAAGAEPCGLGSRDVLRLEAGLLLHGSDMTVRNNPYEVGLGWTVRPDRAEYLAGRSLRAIRDAGIARRIAGFMIHGRAIARHGALMHADGHQIGAVTSGTYSPTVRRPIGLALVDREYTETGTGVEIEVRGRMLPAEIVEMPFVRS